MKQQGGSHYLLNVPPNSSGLVPAAFHTTLKAFGDGLRSSIGSPVAQLTNHSGPCSTPIVLILPSIGAAAGLNQKGFGRAPSRKVELIQAREDLRHGQKIAKYAYDALLANGTWVELKVAARPSVSNDASSDNEQEEAEEAAAVTTVGGGPQVGADRPCPPACPPLQETVGHRVVDVFAAPLADDVSAVRMRCLAVANGTTADTIHIASLLVAPKPTFAKRASAEAE